TDTVEELMRRTDGRHVVQFAVSNGAADLCDVIVGEWPNLHCQAVADERLRVESPEPVRVGPLVRLLEDRGAEVSEARKLRPSLEDVFVEITGIEAGAMKQEKEKSGKGGGR
ncbi:MAG: ABC transporter ATP-binding protein, partial [Phycisphaerae bacterium]